MDLKSGYYYGTEIDEKWWKRCKESTFFMRGNGEYWIDKKGINFRRFMTQKPLFIPFSKIENMKSGWFHAGKAGIGKTVIKIIWKNNHKLLSSGFNFGTGSEVEAFVQKIQRHIDERGRNE